MMVGCPLHTEVDVPTSPPKEKEDVRDAVGGYRDAAPVGLVVPEGVRSVLAAPLFNLKGDVDAVLKGRTVSEYMEDQEEG